ncbi:MULTISPECIES: DUF4365 domain-containing protein [Bradyrhizobium]|uniref:DUF4365 domain-containing protein n=3 Tax=Bradyrhizobium TaxID=374 RepID=A0AAE5X8H0_9BRAD|nr:MULTISPECIES: DUF4365 domain-containing protein [Bradyrhizobium]MCG2631936.1 DUF4365 domain-containing protein [Bradyrhizobium zhengyangense]MCG2644991.1 DUF4365 domain-containing protein [Bradyrhizobium zhengyangense]MCG2672729.1 DUF4365 domain-containing protein [Bradyrhizobium zhengyangense]MDN4985420.1 DUF4365 domain-containing protein [Bradyrhizobium sp. WYCCWR 13022]MDN5002349.1 DUF4365 domain-containing protein [Bradyrhizobium sp. WYCCWR 12677]
MAFPSFIQSSFILEEAVSAERAKDSVRNLLLRVQGKATERERLQVETEETFEFACADADIEYWTKGTAPVLLIVVALKTRKAYCKSLKEWFADPERRKSRRSSSRRRTYQR